MLQYPMHIQWSVTDNAYFATFHDLPECKAYGDTYEEAAKNGREALETFIEAAKEYGKELPEPTDQKSLRDRLDEIEAKIAKSDQNVITTNNGLVRVKHDGLIYEITFK